MPVFSVEGKLGTGKTKWCVWRAQQALREGRRVASNVDLFLPKLTPERAARYIRIPDKPSPFDLEAIGHGNPESYDEDQNGVLILDELATWLNSRSFQDKSRAGVIDWLVHARKLGWDVYLIVQDVNMIDRQVREALVEYSCRCMRMDKVKIPFIGSILQTFGELFGFKRAGYLPRFHLVTARIGSGATQVIAERWAYRGDDLHAAYDTRQVFTTDYPHGAHSVLPPWDWQKPVSWWQRLKQRAAPAPRPAAVLRPKLRAVDLAATLPPDEAWRLARRYAQALPSRPRAANGAW